MEEIVKHDNFFQLGFHENEGDEEEKNPCREDSRFGVLEPGRTGVVACFANRGEFFMLCLFATFIQNLRISCHFGWSVISVGLLGVDELTSLLFMGSLSGRMRGFVAIFEF